MTFDERLSAIATWRSLLEALSQALDEARGDDIRLLELVSGVVMRGLFIVELRSLSAELGLAVTEAQSSQSALKLRMRCLLALGKQTEASAIGSQVQRSPKADEAMKLIEEQFREGKQASAELRERLVKALLES